MPQNGVRRALGTMFAFVTLAGLFGVGWIVMVEGRALTQEGRVLAAILLVLHGSAVTVALGRSPWGDLSELVDALLKWRAGGGNGRG